MWDKDDPKTKWFHLALKIVGALVIFKLGVLVGEFKIIKSMVVGRGEHPKMLFRSGDEGEKGTRYFNKRVMPLGEGDVMMWKGDPAQPSAGVQVIPAPATAPEPAPAP